MLARSLAPPLGALLVTLTACGGGTPAPSPAPVPADAPPSAVTAAPTTGPARFTWSAGRRTVEVRTDAVVTRDAPPAGTAPGDQRVTTVAYVTADLAPGDPPGAVAVTGTVDSLVATAPSAQSGAAMTTLVAGLRYRAASDARGVRVEAADPTVDLRCTAPTGAAALSALGAVRETVPRIPAGLAAGASWRDTTVTASCAGPVLLVAQTVARYESAADPTAPGRLRVTRQTSTTARGTGTAGIRPLIVAASGTARAVYVLDPIRGQLVDGTNEGRAAVTITVSGVAQRFTQQTRTQLTVR